VRRDVHVSSELEANFTATHHALLFGWIAEALSRGVGGQTAERVVRKAVRHYGEGRGKRMAVRAEAAQQILNMDAYRAYGEWEVHPGEIVRTVVKEEKGAVTVRVERCPWSAAWAENGLTAFGRYYCLEIDKALVRGFNPELILEVNGTQPNGSDHCEFVYRDVSQNLGQKGMVMPWTYHAGHLYWSVGEVLVADLARDGRRALARALNRFAERYGDEAAAQIVSYQGVDFSRLPE
jgi:hypothetical protein